MEKPIIATTLSGLFIKQEAWDSAHFLWYQNAAKKLNDESVKEWAGRKDYFKGVDEVMKRLFPSLSENERTKKARELFFESVIKNIEQNPSLVNIDVINYFKELKPKYQIALVTTNTQYALKKIIPAAGLEGFFDIIETSLPEEKDNKAKVFERFISKNKKPLIYIGGGKKESFDYCNKNRIRCILANLENNKEIENVESFHNLDNLKKIIENLD
jgi:phosphoglycolate phosphatase-like HAD superfamily hydrolase